jgi:predicted transglutaminase-like cysteine proteinase
MEFEKHYIKGLILGYCAVMGILTFESQRLPQKHNKPNSISEYQLLKNYPINRELPDCSNCKEFMMDNDIMIRTLAQEITRNSKSKEESAQKILDFVNSNLESRLESIYIDENIEQYAKFPLETLIEGYGDCEDFALLSGSLMKSIGIEVTLIYLKEGVGKAKGPHVTLGVNGNFSGQFYEFNKKKYYHADNGWKIGEINNLFLDREFEVYSLE